jgi:hypothetical protein
MGAFFSLLVLPIAILNFAGGIVGGIWLAVLGQWSLLGVGLAAGIASTMMLGLLLMPGMLFAAPAAVAMEKGHYVIGILSGAIALLWTHVVVIAWCLVTFSFVVEQSKAGPIWPYLLWAYSVATGPWTYMASRETQANPNSPADITAFFACLGAAAMMATYVLISRPTIYAVGIAFVAPMGVCFLFQIAIYVLAAIGPRRDIQQL